MSKKNLKPHFLSVMLCFLKMGVIGFGSGAALIPVIENELVQKRNWIKKERFDFCVMIASISPASLPISLCAIWNNKYALLSAFSMALPGPLIFLVISTGFSLIGEAGIRYIGFASVGIIVFILLIIFSFIRKKYTQFLAKAKNTRIQYLLVMIVSFLLTAGNSVRRLISLLLPYPTNSPSIFSISIMDLIFILFFIVFFATGSKLKFGIALVLSGLYALSSGGMEIWSEWRFVFATMMVILALVALVYDVGTKKGIAKKVAFDYRPLKSLALFLGIASIFTLFVFLIFKDANTWAFSFRVIMSALTSFGGGEAYIPVGDAVFVQSGFISAEVFYGQIIGIATAMPGPFIMSVIAGIGFAYGNSLGGVLVGWVFGILAIVLVVTATAFGALILLTCFDKFKESHRLLMMIKYMIPLVCGMLISIALTLLSQASLILIQEGVASWMSVGVVVGLFILILLLRQIIQMNDLLLLLVCSFGTLMTLSILF